MKISDICWFDSLEPAKRAHDDALPATSSCCRAVCCLVRVPLLSRRSREWEVQEAQEKRIVCFASFLYGHAQPLVSLFFFFLFSVCRNHDYLWVERRPSLSYLGYCCGGCSGHLLPLLLPQRREESARFGESGPRLADREGDNARYANLTLPPRCFVSHGARKHVRHTKLEGLLVPSCVLYFCSLSAAPRATIVMLLKNADANAYYAIESMDKNFNQVGASAGQTRLPVTVFVCVCVVARVCVCAYRSTATP